MAGPSGEVKYPDYIADAHEEVIGSPGGGDTLTENMLTLVETVIQDVKNPYKGKDAYVPSTVLDRMEQKLDLLRDDITGIASETTTWENMLNAVHNNIDTLVPTDTDLEAEVVAYRDSLTLDLARAYNRISIVFFDVNALASTQHFGGLAVVEAEVLNKVAIFRATRKNELSRERIQAHLQGVQQAISIMTVRLQSRASLAGLYDQWGKAKIAAEQNQTLQQADLRAQEAMWEIRVLTEGSRIIGATAGIPGMSEGLSKWQMGLMTVSTFASIGTGLMGAASGMNPMSSMMPMLMMMM